MHVRKCRFVRVILVLSLARSPDCVGCVLGVSLGVKAAPMLVMAVSTPRIASATGMRTTLMSKYRSISVSLLGPGQGHGGVARRTWAYLLVSDVDE